MIKRTRDGIMERAETELVVRRSPAPGPRPGRYIQPVQKVVGFDLKADLSVGTADLPPLFRQRVRRRIWLHWDGNNNAVEERNKSAAIGAGATEDSIDLPSLDRIAAWTLDLPPPAVP